MSNSSAPKPTPPAQATGSTAPKPNSPSAPFNYAAAAKKSKPSPAAVTSGDVTGYVNGVSQAGSSPTVPAATAIAQAASGTNSNPTSPPAPAPPSRKTSVKVDGVSVPQSRVDAIRNGAESDVAFGTANDKNAVLSSSPAAPPSLNNGAPKAFGAVPAQATSPTSTPAAAKAPINLHAFFTGGGSSNNSSSSPAPIPEQRRSLATYDPSASRSPQPSTSPLPVPHPHSQLSNNSASFVPRQIPAPFIPQQQQQQQQNQAFSPPSQYYGQPGSYKGPSPQNIPNGNSPYGGPGGAPSGNSAPGSRPGSFVGSPSMQSRPPPQQHRPSFSQQATSPRMSNPPLPPQGMYMPQNHYAHAYNPYNAQYQAYPGGFVPGQGPPPLSNSPSNSTPSTGIHTPKPGSTVPPSPSTVHSIAPSTPNSSSFQYSSPQQQSSALPRAFSPQQANNSTPLRSLSLAGAAAPEFKPSTDSPIFMPTPRKSAAIKIVKPDENMLKAKAEKDKAAKEAKDKAAAEEQKKREEEKAKAQAEADSKKKAEEEAESKRKAEEEEAQKAKAAEEEKQQKAAAEEEKKVAEEKKAAEEKQAAEEKKAAEDKKEAEQKEAAEKQQAEEKKVADEKEKKEAEEKEAEEKKPAATDSFKAATGASNDSAPSTPGQEVAGLHVKSADADAVRAEEDALLADEQAATEPKDAAQALVEARENLNAEASNKDVSPVTPSSALPSFLPAKPSTDLSREASSSKAPAASSPSSAAIASARPISDLANVSYPESSKAPASELNIDSEPGKYRYDRDFLLQFMAICQEKPEHLPNLEAMGMVGDDNAPRGNMDRRSQRGGAMGAPSRTASSSGAFGRSASIGGVGGGAFGGMGNFGQAGSGTSSEQRFAASLNRSTSGAFGGARGSMSRTTSQSGMGGAFGGGGGRNKSERGSKRRGEKDHVKDDSRKPGQHVAGEGFEDATLGPRSATGWAPGVIAGGSAAVDTNSPEMVQRKVKALLNKLTLERFDSISDQILEWANRSIDESDGRILRQVIALIFEKATDEATWSEMYARLCRKLMERVSTEVRDETVKAQDGTPVAGGALFRKYLLNRCQEDYENGWKNKEAATAAAKSKEADDKAKQDANEAAKKDAEESGTKEEDQKEAELLSDEYYAAQKAKRRGLGLVRFIGELYRLQMLTERIMHECIKKLLSNTENPEEEDVESLCRLLTTVGKGLDNPKAKQHMDIYFSRMNQIANSPKVSSRIRFMILDVVDLRASRWASKQAAAGPKTISEIHADAQKQAEESARRTASSGGKLPRLGDQLSRPNSRRGQGRDFGVAQAGPDGWTTQPQRPAKAGAEAAMEIAAVSTVSVAPQSRRVSNAFSRNLGSVSSLSFGFFEKEYCFKSPSLRVSAAASMDAVTAEKFSPASFLDKKETGVLHFVKYHGLGNDFILVDNRDSSEPKITQEQAAKLCDRNFGVGADGVIFAMPGVNGTDYAMRIFNSDGSEPEMCGNGVRCFARFIAELENLQGKHSFTIHTGAGLIVPEIQDDGQVKVDMGTPILKAQDVPTKLSGNKGEAVVEAELVVDGVSWNVTCVSMGNPHCITFGKKGGPNLKVDDLNLPEIGPKFEHHEMFPARTNTEFVEVLSRSHLKMRVWERGAGATLACGTGACALVVAAVLEGRADRKCTVDLPGGPLEIEWKQEDNHIYMTGPAEAVFYGSALL